MRHQGIRGGTAELIGAYGSGVEFETYRRELTGYCYRLLGSGFEAEDAVQETFVRAWKAGYDEHRGSPRTWLYRIATNICFDMLRSAQRRALAMDLGPEAAEFGAAAAEHFWIQPMPDHRALPEDAVVQRESLRLAFVAALQHLPPKQRAVLILRDVLCWRAEEVAGLLGTSVAAVTSAVQRARSTMRTVGPAPAVPDPARRELLDRYCAAFERHDVEALVALLHEDATMTMPPVRWWLRGVDAIRSALLDPAASCAGARLVPTATVGGTPAYWQTRPGPDGGHTPFGLVLFDTAGGAVTGVTTFLDAPRLLTLFPYNLRGPVSGRGTASPSSTAACSTE
jgi:RNA polymerase sigma-70 factor (ECF subfamily)